MNAHTPHKPAASPAQAPRKGRISRRIRDAISLRVKKGYTLDDAAREAGLSPSGFYKALKRDEVKELLEKEQAQYIQSVEAIRARHKSRAIEIAAELMESASSEAVRMRAVEFFAGESKAAAVNVQINNEISRGYEYIPPGAQVIDVTPSSGPADSTTDASQPESQGNKGE